MQKRKLGQPHKGWKAAAKEKVRRPPMCDGCGAKRSDPPSKLCVGCQAYREHQA
jgi:hypothetical protein